MAPESLIDRFVANETKRHEQRLARLDELRTALACAEALKAAFPDAPIEIKEWTNGRDNIEVEVVVENIKTDVAPYIEWVTDWAETQGFTGFDFNETSDYVSSYTTQRDFHTDLLTLSAELKADGAGCRKVVVGYEEVAPQPIYKIVCEE